MPVVEGDAIDTQAWYSAKINIIGDDIKETILARAMASVITKFHFPSENVRVSLWNVAYQLLFRLHQYGWLHV